MDCNVCFDKISNTSSVTCPFCDFICCKTCIQRYSLESTEDLNCMNCHRYFDKSTQRKLFTKVFIDKTYKKRREELLFQREHALLPSTQPAITLERTKRVMSKEIENLRNEHQKRLREIARINKRISDLTFAIYNINLENMLDIDDVRSAATFVMKCSQENCKGFISRAYKCGTCCEYTCPECREPKKGRFDEAHVCDEDKKKTVALISRECKACVSCGTLIFKTEGCPQMFCTQCNILFDWNTGKKISHSSGHNPHFIQWLRDNGRNTRDVGDVMCGGLPDIRVIIEKMRIRPGSDAAIQISLIVRILLHIHHYERPRYPIIWNNDNDSEFLRVKWSLGDYTDDEFKVIRQRMEKRNCLKKEIGLVYEMLINSATDILQRFVHSPNPDNKLVFDELENIRTIVNENMHNIAKDFSNKTPRITMNWDHVPKY